MLLDPGTLPESQSQSHSVGYQPREKVTKRRNYDVNLPRHRPGNCVSLQVRAKTASTLCSEIPGNVYGGISLEYGSHSTGTTLRLCV